MHTERTLNEIQDSTRTAVLFTGQGAQSVGMGRDIAEASAAARDIYRRANEVLGYDLAGLCFDGPADRLEQTDLQQPAIFVTSVAIWEALGGIQAFEPPPAAMAGLSLGEYSALYAAGSLAFEDALRLVQKRGELMQKAAQSPRGGMVSIMGLEPGQVEELCRAAGEAGIIRPANYNCPGQIVVSGEKAACELFVRLTEEAGGRGIPLKVAGAFHSPLMKPAAEGLAQMLATTAFTKPRIPVIANVNCEPHRDADTMRAWLTEQLTRPVRWQASMERLISEGIEEFVEIGPGRVLTGLMRKISRQTPVTNIATAESLASLTTRAS